MTPAHCRSSETRRFVVGKQVLIDNVLNVRYAVDKNSPSLERVYGTI